MAKTLSCFSSELSSIYAAMIPKGLMTRFLALQTKHHILPGDISLYFADGVGSA